MVLVESAYTFERRPDVRASRFERTDTEELKFTSETPILGDASTKSSINAR